MSSSKSRTFAGASSGTTSAQRLGRKPATRLTPPIVVRGSRRLAIAATTSPGAAAGSASNSKYACDAVPSAKMPPWGVLMPQFPTKPLRCHPKVRVRLRNSAGQQTSFQHEVEPESPVTVLVEEDDDGVAVVPLDRPVAQLRMADRRPDLERVRAYVSMSQARVAVVAVAAGSRERLAEVAEDVLASAPGGLRVTPDHLDAAALVLFAAVLRRR